MFIHLKAFLFGSGSEYSGVGSFLSLLCGRLRQQLFTSLLMFWCPVSAKLLLVACVAAPEVSLPWWDVQTGCLNVCCLHDFAIGKRKIYPASGP